jgi:(p)ppGpp synthase/HD superfamily hydrolase
MTQANWSQDAYIKAYRFAAQAHQGQTVPGTDLPYLMHLSFVSMEVIAALQVEPGRDGDLAVQCALLHDTLEDTPVTYAEVFREFGPRVAAGVLALTKNADLPKEHQMGDSLRRIAQQPREVGMVKLADRVTNLQPPPAYWTAQKIEAYRAEAEQILAALGVSSPSLAARLKAKIAAYPLN